jgi:hypothetical protein
MSENELIQHLKTAIDDIRHKGKCIEEDSLRFDAEITETLKSGRELCEKYLTKPFNDSFNI